MLHFIALCNTETWRWYNLPKNWCPVVECSTRRTLSPCIRHNWCGIDFIFVTRVDLQLDDPFTLIECLLNIIPLLYDGWSSRCGGLVIYFIICFRALKPSHRILMVKTVSVILLLSAFSFLDGFCTSSRNDGGHASERRALMEVIILIVSLIGWKVSGYDFADLYFYIELSFTLMKAIRRYLNDKAAKR